MYQVVLVDDDVLVTEFMEKIIPWGQYGFHVVATFNDSLLAYEYLKENKCDVLITDIGMPRLNGIELISNLKERNNDAYHIILSCHDEFHFAQQALKLEVFDYILKESMEEEQVVALLERLKIVMDDELQLKHHQVKITKFLKQNNTSLKTSFIENLMAEQYMTDDTWWSEQEDLLDMDFSCERYTVALCFVDQYQDAIDRYHKEVLLQFSLNNAIPEVLAKFQKGVQIFFLQGKFLILFPLLDKKPLEMQPLVERALKEMQSEISTFLKISVTSVIGGENQLREGLGKSLKLFLDNKEVRFYYPHGTIQHLQTIPYTDQSIFQDYIEVVHELRRMIMNKDEDQVKESIRNYVTEVKEEHYAPAAVKDWAIKLVLDIKIYLNAQAYFEDKDFMTMTDQLVQNVETFEHLQSLLTDILVKLMGRVDQIEGAPKNEYIQQAQMYIRSHLNEKISLQDVATALHLNASYFSRMFKKETGESFIEFTTRIKMEKAKELLDNTVFTVEQIATEVGFDSKGYFLKTFKKQFGMSPQAYKYKEITTKE